MKNKLTAEERLMQEKLNDASFSYQEAHWAEIQQQMAPKGFMGKYGSFVKATLGLAILAVSVFTVNQFTEEEPANVPDPQEVISPVKELVETPTPETENSEDLTISGSEDEILESSDKMEVVSTEATETSAKQKNIVEEEPATLTVDDLESAEEHQKEVASIKLIAPQVVYPLCINREIRAISKFKGKIAEDVAIRWYLNGKRIQGNLMATSFSVANAGDYELKVQAYHQGIKIDEASSRFVVESPIDLDFTAEDQTDPFSDHAVKLTAQSSRIAGLNWSVKDRDEVFNGDEVNINFEKEGMYEVSLSHISEAGCETKISRRIAVRTDYDPAFPRQFTPNGDNTNDVFYVKAFSILPHRSYQLQVFGLDNKLVYETNSVLEQDGWNGRLNNKGNLLAAGKYAYLIRIVNEEGKELTYRGKIQLYYN